MKLVFILSLGRSGSTLLASMLNMHPNIHVPVELLGLYTEVPGRLKYYGNLHHIRHRERLAAGLQFVGQLNEFGVALNRDVFLRELEDSDYSVRSVIHAFYRSLQPPGKRVLVDKTPNSAMYCRTMNRLFPDARFIHLVRDGRDVAMSSMGVRHGLNFRNLYELSTTWQEHNLSIWRFGQEHPGKYMLVKYEQLVAEPEAVLRGICDFVSEPFDSAVLEFDQGEFASVNAQVLDHHHNLTRGVLRGNVRKWTTQMPAPDARIYERLAARALRHFGYPCEGSKLSSRDRMKVAGLALDTRVRGALRLLRRLRTEAVFRSAVLAKRVLRR